MSVSITKEGLVKASGFSEKFINPYDLEYYVEPDNSVWIRIIHHNTPASSRFSSTDTFDSSVYYDTNKWFYASLVNKITNGTYEFMIKQKATSDGTEVKYRWIQSKNPFTAAYGDVDAADVTKITTSGYSTSGTFGGIYKKSSLANTYFTANDGASSSNWWGAFGCWAAYQGGIPGWNQTVITTGYLDLYLRIDNQINNIASIFDNSIMATEFIEW